MRKREKERENEATAAPRSQSPSRRITEVDPSAAAHVVDSDSEVRIGGVSGGLNCTAARLDRDMESVSEDVEAVDSKI